MNDEHELVEGLCLAYGDPIEKAFIRAVSHYYELHARELLTIRSASKASLISDYIFQFAQEELEGKGPFEFISNRNMRFIGYDSKLLIRIKKLNKKRKPSVNRTFAANRFNTQTDMDLLKDAKALNIYLGYVLNNKSGNIDEVAFAYPNTSGVIAWTINVNELRAQKTLDLDIAMPRKEDKPRRASRLSPKMPKRKTS
jgi:hypothetical protein